jgi:hypothetical protein
VASHQSGVTSSGSAVDGGSCTSGFDCSPNSEYCLVLQTPEGSSGQCLAIPAYCQQNYDYLDGLCGCLVQEVPPSGQGLCSTDVGSGGGLYVTLTGTGC